MGVEGRSVGRLAWEGGEVGGHERVWEKGEGRMEGEGRWEGTGEGGGRGKTGGRKEADTKE